MVIGVGRCFQNVVIRGSPSLVNAKWREVDGSKGLSSAIFAVLFGPVSAK